MKILNYTLQFAAAVCITTASDAWATEAGADSSIISVLRTVPNSDLASKAADLVSQADAIRQPLVTSDVVKAALQVNPAAATMVVGKIAKLVPAMAANAALAAVSIHPEQAPYIAAAAATAAPSKAGEIVKALCRALPTSYRAIAEAVAHAVPSATHEILTAVADAIPSLKATLAQVQAMQDNGSMSVYSILAQVGDVASLDVTRNFVRKSVPPPPPVTSGSSGSSGSSGTSGSSGSSGTGGTPPPPILIIQPTAGTAVTSQGDASLSGAITGGRSGSSE